MSERTQWELSVWHLQGLNAMCQGVYKVTTADKPRVTANCPLTRLHLGLLALCISLIAEYTSRSFSTASKDYKANEYSDTILEKKGELAAV